MMMRITIVDAPIVTIKLAAATITTNKMEYKVNLFIFIINAEVIDIITDTGC